MAHEFYASNRIKMLPLKQLLAGEPGMPRDEKWRQMNGVNRFKCISHFTEQRLIGAVAEANAGAAAVAF
jgi:hypothetical protein